jgi:hypothetical protein
MQIREITIQEGLGWELTKGISRAARDQFIQKATGLSDPYMTTQMPQTQQEPVQVGTATVADPRTAGARSRVAAAARRGRPAPVVNPAAIPQQYTLDGNPLDPKNPIHAKLIAQMQSQGVINATTPTAK